MSRPNTPSMEKYSSDEFEKEMDDRFQENNNDRELRKSPVSPRLRSPGRSPNRCTGVPNNSKYNHNISIPNGNDLTGGKRSPNSMTTVEDMMEELIGDVNAMIESAADIVESANQIRTLVHHTLESIDFQSPIVSQLGLIGTIKDLRRETVRTVVDADRAHLRYRKVLSEFTQLRRCLRRVGALPVPGSYGASYIYGSGNSCRGTDFRGSANYYRNLGDS